MLSPKLLSISFRFRVHFIRHNVKWQQTQSKKLSISQVYLLINKEQYLSLCSDPLSFRSMNPKTTVVTSVLLLQHCGYCHLQQVSWRICWYEWASWLPSLLCETKSFRQEKSLLVRLLPCSGEVNALLCSMDPKIIKSVTPRSLRKCFLTSQQFHKKIGMPRGDILEKPLMIC